MGFFNVFGHKRKRPLVVPAPPNLDLPEFPEPKDLSELSLEMEKSLSGGAKKGKSGRLFQKPKPVVSRPKHISMPKFEVGIPQQPDFYEGSSSRFLDVDSFKSLVDNIDDIKSKLDHSSRVMSRLESVNSEQDKLLHMWHERVKDVHDKIVFADEILFKRG